ncbi:MAG: hypothetical protein QHH26_13490 [Armatimonadota bacterium]|nr:hypothetical protein [Armatimonadota bacterium]
MEKVEIGMTVRLHSGGPILTVNTQPDENGYVTCVWFDKDEHVRAYTSPMSSLELVKTKGSDVEDEAGETTAHEIEEDRIEEDGFTDHSEYDRDDGLFDDFQDLFLEKGCGEGYSCEECENVGCPAHPCN